MFEMLIQDVKERTVHAGTVHSIAHESGVPERDVEKIYMRELAKLRETARIRDYLPVLTARRVREALRNIGNH